MSFEISKNGFRMYKPSWQANPGAAMKAANRATSDSYFSNFATLGGNLLTTVNDQSAGMIEIVSKQVQTRLQADYAKKLEQAKAGLNVIV
jgi:hypothetical protein